MQPRFGAKKEVLSPDLALLVAQQGQGGVAVPLQGELSVNEQAIEFSKRGQNLKFLWEGGVLRQEGEKLLAQAEEGGVNVVNNACLLYTSPSPRDRTRSRMPSSA